MIVDSYLELYTTLFGWMWYNTIWFVLRDSGLLFLPFVGIIADRFMEYRKGDEFGEGEGRTLKALEVEIFLALVVIVFAGSPAVPLAAEEVTYTPPGMIFGEEDDRDSVDASESGVTYGTEGFIAPPDNVDVPVVWNFILQLSTGINRAIMEDIPPAPPMRLYAESLRSAKITDPHLKRELNDFVRDCYLSARSKYMREKPSSAGIDALLNEHGENDLDFVGSRVYIALDGYYNFFRSRTIREPFVFSAVRDTEWDANDPNRPQFGKPTCEEWWTTDAVGLKDKLIASDSATFLDELGALVDAAFDEDKRHDAIIRNLLTNSPVSWTASGYDYAYAHLQNQNIFDVSTEDGLTVLGGWIATMWESATTEVGTFVMINATSIFQAILIMFLVAFLPFALMLSKYDLGVVLVCIWAFFTLKFLTVIWYFCWWIDQNLWASMYPDPGMITEFMQLASADKKMLLSYIVNTMYIVAPTLFILVSSWCGFQMLSGMAGLKSSAMGGLKNSGGAPFRLASAAATKGKSLKGGK